VVCDVLVIVVVVVVLGIIVVVGVIAVVGVWRVEGCQHEQAGGSGDDVGCSSDGDDGGDGIIAAAAVLSK